MHSCRRPQHSATRTSVYSHFTRLNCWKKICRTHCTCTVRVLVVFSSLSVVDSLLLRHIFNFLTALLVYFLYKFRNYSISLPQKSNVQVVTGTLKHNGVGWNGGVSTCPVHRLLHSTKCLAACHFHQTKNTIFTQNNQVLVNLMHMALTVDLIVLQRWRQFSNRAKLLIVF